MHYIYYIVVCIHSIGSLNKAAMREEEKRVYEVERDASKEYKNPLLLSAKSPHVYFLFQEYYNGSVQNLTFSCSPKQQTLSLLEQWCRYSWGNISLSCY